MDTVGLYIVQQTIYDWKNDKFSRQTNIFMKVCIDQ